MNSSQLLDFRNVLYIFINSINMNLLNIYYKLGAIIMASLIAQLIKNLQCRRPWFYSWVGKIHWRRDRLPSPRFLDFPGGSAAKESTCNVGEMFSSVALFTFPTERLQLLFEANIFTPGK